MPTQKELYELSLFAHVTGGTTHEPETAPTDPDAAARPYPLQFVLNAAVASR
jgi:hypothetical protein